jgi:hypothetical protein
LTAEENKKSGKEERRRPDCRWLALPPRLRSS